jgi:hypothetical protein
MLDELFDVNVKSIVITENPNDYEEDYYNPDVQNETVKEEALAEYERYETKYAQEHPYTQADVSDETINMLFGDNWDGGYADVTPLVSEAAEELALQMTMYSSMSDWLNDQKLLAENNIAANTGLYQIQQSAENTKYHYEELTNTISNFKSFGFTTGSSNVLWSADNILANIENIGSNILTLEGNINNIISYIQGSNIIGRDVTNMIDEQSSFLVNIMAQQDLNNLLANFPHQVAHKFMNADYAQNLFTLPRQLFSKLSGIVTTLSSIQAPTNIVSALETVKILRSTVQQMQDVMAMISEGTTAITNMKNNIANGNYIGVFLQAKNACKFVEKTSQFAAQYPYNQAYETEGGHIFETDNTPGKERLHIQHCTGTDVEIAPNGDMVSKIKNDCQFIVEKDLQNHVKGNQLMLVDDTSEVQSKTMILTATEDLNISAKTTTYTTDTLTLLTDDTMMTADGNMTLAANSAASFSSVGPLYISSTSQIIMDAPSIIIGDGRASVIKLNSLNSITSTSVNNTINANTTNVKSNAVFVGEGLIKMNGFITLN